MDEARVKNLGRPDEVMEFPGGHAELVVVQEVTVGRSVLEPGWRWSTHIKPVVGTEWCESSHFGVMLSGRLRVVTGTGEEYEVGPNDVYHIAPGHDGYVVGDEPAVAIEWSGMRGWAAALESMHERVLANVLFTDVVGSTATAVRAGDARWRDMLGQLNAATREILSRYRGREIKNTGDGILAIFDGAARAVRCGAELARAAGRTGIAIRVAIHTGEVDLVDDDVRGVTVHEAARVLGAAGPGEVLVTQITRDLAAASGLRFADRGARELKGLEGLRRLYALESE